MDDVEKSLYCTYLWGVNKPNQQKYRGYKNKIILNNAAKPDHSSFATLFHIHAVPR